VTEPQQPIDDSVISARGGWVKPSANPPSNPPIYQTTAFDLDGLDQLAEIVSGEQHGYIYTRDGNPNQSAFAEDVARLEHAEEGVVGASGMGVISALVMSHCKTGDHILAARVLYGRTVQLLQQMQKSFGVEVTFFDANDPASLSSLVRPETKLCLVEGISNPLMEVADIPAIVQAVGKVPVIVDNTFATPILQKPIEMGASAVVHSASKYLNGHGDVMMGVIVGNKYIIRRTRQFLALFGANGNPLESWLASRGLRTLPLRMKQVSQTAMILSEWLDAHPKVERVYYPGLSNHSSYEIAQRLLPQGCGGMLAFDLKAGKASVNSFLKSLHESIPFSPTLADSRSTLSYPTGTSHKFMSAEERAEYGIKDGLIRLSVGLEDAASLQTELESAFNQL
jgi:cystathionine beta-lyase/cystathionine gamma-synthase